MGRMLVLAILGLAWNAIAGVLVSNEEHSVTGGPAQPVQMGEETNNTVITATQLSFDQQKHKAVFEENVVVTDREIKITADRLEVLFTADNKVDRIEAEGHVTIIRKDLKATGEKAAYDIKEGKMRLTGNPRIQRDQDTLTGETVTLWRNSKRILCEPNARLVISSDQDMNRSFKE